jgi:glycosyltransferase involved in cell wall biosynthesis
MKVLIISKIYYHHLTPFANFLATKYGNDNLTYIYYEEQNKIKYNVKSNPKFSIFNINSLDKNIFLEYFNEYDIVYFSIKSLILKCNSRIKSKKSTFYFSERWFKPRFRYLKYLKISNWLYLYYLNKFIKTNYFYYLAQGQYAKSDLTPFIGNSDNIKNFGYFSNANELFITHKNFNKRLIWIGRDVSWKGFKFLLYSLFKISNIFTDYKLTIILNKKNILFENLAFKYLPFGSYKIFYDLDNNQVKKFLFESDLLLITSNANEGWGYIANEALESKCNILVSNIVGSVNIMLYNNLNALTYENNNWLDFSYKIIYFFNSKFIRNKLSNNLINFTPNMIMSNPSYGNKFINYFTNDKEIQKINIAVIYPFLPIYRIPIFNKLSTSDKYNFHFIFGQNKSSVESLEKNFYYFELIKFTFTFINNIYYKNILYQYNLFKIIRNNKYQAVIFLADPHFITTTLLSIYLKIKNINIIYWTHGFKKNHSIFKNIFYKLYFKIPNVIFLYSNINNTYYNFPNSKFKYIYNSLDYEKHKSFRSLIDEKELKKFRNTLFNDDVVFQILFISRLTLKKDILRYLPFFSKLLNLGFNFKLLIIGNGDQDNDIINFIKFNKLENNIIKFPAIYDENILFKYISSSDISIFPNEVGLACIHSLSYGTPVITHNNFYYNMPESEVIISEYNGDYFEYENYFDLNLKILNWYNLSKTIERNKIRNQCYDLIDKYYNPDYQNKIIIQTLNDLFK